MKMLTFRMALLAAGYTYKEMFEELTSSSRRTKEHRKLCTGERKPINRHFICSKSCILTGRFSHASINNATIEHMVPDIYEQTW